MYKFKGVTMDKVNVANIFKDMCQEVMGVNVINATPRVALLSAVDNAISQIDKLNDYAQKHIDKLNVFAVSNLVIVADTVRLRISKTSIVTKPSDNTAKAVYYLLVGVSLTCEKIRSINTGNSIYLLNLANALLEEANNILAMRNVDSANSITTNFKKLQQATDEGEYSSTLEDIIEWADSLIFKYKG